MEYEPGASALEELIRSLRLAATANHDVGMDATGHLLTEAADEIDLLREALKVIAAGIPGPCLFATEVLQGRFALQASAACGSSKPLPQVKT